ncbi:hypothetical protein [Terrabacter terrigena]|uniref:Uncharacterized protein n=1 Tax=Terrabacter terrigena TaxID=574718 RepID=A0ABW3MZB3_9MICO
MVLPTANTPGYGLLDGHVACDCLIAWTPVFQRLCELKGYGHPVVWQATGLNPNSVGTHAAGDTIDFGGLGNARAMLAREMGAWATWPRDWAPADGGQHTHCVLAGGPHNANTSRYQTTAVRAGYNGLGPDGRAGRDPLSPPKTYRTWKQGIAWAKGEINRIEEAMYTDADRARDVATKAAVDRLIAQEASRDAALQAAIDGLGSAESGRYGYYSQKLNQILADMAADDASPVTISPDQVGTVADEVARRVVASLPKAPTP